MEGSTVGRVSNRHLLEAIEELTEAVTLPTYTDPHAPVLTLDKGEYYGTETCSNRRRSATSSTTSTRCFDEPST